MPHVELLRWCSLGVFTNEWGSDISETRGKPYILVMRQAHLKAHPKGTKEVPHKLPFSSWFKVCKQKKRGKKKGFYAMNGKIFWASKNLVSNQSNQLQPNYSLHSLSTDCALLLHSECKLCATFVLWIWGEWSFEWKVKWQSIKAMSLYSHLDLQTLHFTFCLWYKQSISTVLCSGSVRVGTT